MKYDPCAPDRYREYRRYRFSRNMPEFYTAVEVEVLATNTPEAARLAAKALYPRLPSIDPVILRDISEGLFTVADIFKMKLIKIDE